jgi:hypothetical protein
MKLLTLIMLFAACRMLADDDTNVVAAGDWSQPVGTEHGPAVRGRLIVCHFPDQVRPGFKTPTAAYLETHTVVWLELQEVSSTVRPVGVYRDTLPPHIGLHCELRDSGGKLIPRSADGLFAGSFTYFWSRLKPHESVRWHVSYYVGYREDGVLAVHLKNGEFWDVHPSKTNEYYLSGTFTPHVPENETPPSDIEAWHGTLTLPGVKIPIKIQ